MRSKHIAALITFSATFAFSAFIALIFAAPKIADVPPVRDYQFKSYSGNSCRKNTGHKIKEFLTRDKLNGSNRESVSLSYDEEYISRESLAVFSEGVTEYVAQSSSMDDSRFPSDFQRAWREHMSAWNDLAEFLEDSKNESISYDEFYPRLYDYNDRISSTWQTTLRIGREYGADLPAGF